MPTRSADTSPEAEAVLVRLAREMPPAEKLQIAASMSRAIRELAEVGVRSRYPRASDDEVRKRVAALVLPRDIVIAAYGWTLSRRGTDWT